MLHDREEFPEISGWMVIEQFIEGAMQTQIMTFIIIEQLIVRYMIEPKIHSQDNNDQQKNVGNTL